VLGVLALTVYSHRAMGGGGRGREEGGGLRGWFWWWGRACVVGSSEAAGLRAKFEAGAAVQQG
jgi:hypothetical protein